MRFARMLVMGQTGGIMLGLTALALQPPAHGRMLLLPLDRAAEARLVPLALGSGARLIGRGPLAGSLVVSADRDRLDTVFNNGILVMAAPPAGCDA